MYRYDFCAQLKVYHNYIFSGSYLGTDPACALKVEHTGMCIFNNWWQHTSFVSAFLTVGLHFWAFTKFLNWIMRVNVMSFVEVVFNWITYLFTLHWNSIPEFNNLCMLQNIYTIYFKFMQNNNEAHKNEHINWNSWNIRTP